MDNAKDTNIDIINEITEYSNKLYNATINIYEGKILGNFAFAALKILKNLSNRLLNVYSLNKVIVSFKAFEMDWLIYQYFWAFYDYVWTAVLESVNLIYQQKDFIEKEGVLKKEGAKKFIESYRPFEFLYELRIMVNHYKANRLSIDDLIDSIKAFNKETEATINYHLELIKKSGKKLAPVSYEKLEDFKNTLKICKVKEDSNILKKESGFNSKDELDNGLEEINEDDLKSRFKKEKEIVFQKIIFSTPKNYFKGLSDPNESIFYICLSNDVVIRIYIYPFLYEIIDGLKIIIDKNYVQSK